MALLVPNYLRVSGIQGTTIRYTWDDWDVEAVDMPLDESLRERLGAMSQRAVVAFTIGTAEWIVYRFGALSDDPVPAQRLEAAWAQVVDFRYSFEEDINLDEWTGPVRGPIGIAIRRVVYAIQQAESGLDPGWRACRASKLAEHVIMDSTPYRNWRERILDRLEALYPLDPDETLGEVVPREALDPEYLFSVDQTESLVNQFLARLDYNINPFLNSPNKILAQGFRGTPYIFDIERDRRERFEW
jgi:hypothetical protein